MYEKNDFFDGIEENNFDFLDFNFDDLDVFGENRTPIHLEQELKQDDEKLSTPSDLLSWIPSEQFDLFPILDSQSPPQVEHSSKKEKT